VSQFEFYRVDKHPAVAEARTLQEAARMSAARVVLAILLVGSGAALSYVGGFIWWAEPTPTYALTPT
jgi:hypothetical protein